MLEVLHSSGRKAAFDTSLLSFGTFICSGGRKWPERKLSHPLDDILNLNTTLAPAKIKNTHEAFKSHCENCGACKCTVLLWNLLCLGSEDLTWRGKPMNYFSLPISVPEIRYSLQ